VSNPPRDDRTRIASSSKYKNPTQGPAPDDFAVGEVIGGSYKVLSYIGGGGMGTVYRVYHLFLDKELALKTLSANRITEVAWRRFQIEGQAIARLDHPNIIRIYDLGITGKNQPYYVMDVVDGVSLSQLLQDRGALPPALALPVFRQVSAGLAYAHEHGIIHRDLKPANIMLLQSTSAAVSASQSTAVLTAKILDFGLAKLTDLAGGGASGLTKTGEIFGSPLYMSPEQAQGLTIDETTDIYSFGCTLFEALSGEPPLKGANAIETMLMHQSKVPPRLAQVRPDLIFSQELETLVARLLAKKPKDRFSSFAEIASQILLLERRLDKSLAPVSVAISSRKPGLPEGQVTGEFTDPPLPSVTSKRWFWPTALASSAIFLVLLGAGAYHFFAPSAAPEQKDFSLPAPKATPTTEVQAKAPSHDQDPETPFSHIEAGSTGQVRVFDFPQDQSLGQVRYILRDDKLREQMIAGWQQDHPSAENPYVKEGVPAQGRRVFPLRADVGFEPSDEVCNTPGIFKRFKSDDLWQLSLAYKTFVDSDFIPYIKHLKGLRELVLTDTAVDDKAIKVLDGLTGLQHLTLDGTKISGEALGKSAVIKRIHTLSFKDCKDIGKLIKAIEYYSNIGDLSLDLNELTSDDIRALAHIPNLWKLCVNHCPVGDNGVKLLTTAKSLTNLDVTDPALTPKTVAYFASMNLKKLVISGAGWSAADKANLHVAMAKHAHSCALTIKADKP
jgi:serine/threonine protein kinase